MMLEDCGRCKWFTYQRWQPATCECVTDSINRFFCFESKALEGMENIKFVFGFIKCFQFNNTEFNSWVSIKFVVKISGKTFSVYLYPFNTIIKMAHLWFVLFFSLEVHRKTLSILNSLWHNCTFIFADLTFMLLAWLVAVENLCALVAWKNYEWH